MKFPGYISTSERTCSVVGYLDKDNMKDKTKYVDQKGYLDEDGQIWLFNQEGKPRYPNEYPFFWFNEDGEAEFSHPTEIILSAFHEDNIKDMSIVSIVEKTEPNEELFDEDEINDMNAASAFYIPIIKPEDDYMKKVVKAAIIKTGKDINKLKSKTSEKYQIPNMKSALMGKTKMSGFYFCIWMNLLGLDFTISVFDNGEDKQSTLKHPIVYDSHTDKVGELINGDVVDTLSNIKEELDTIINESEE